MARRYRTRRSGNRVYRTQIVNNRSGSRRGGYNAGGLRMSNEFMIGALVGFTDLDQKLPAQLVLGAATAPIRGIGKYKAAAQGIIFGNLIQQVTKGGLNVGSGSGFKGI